MSLLEITEKAHKLHRDLKNKIDQTGALPANFPWPEQPIYYPE